MTFRTDDHNNPAAFTTDIAREGGLVYDSEYVEGEPFTAGNITLYTAKLIGDPVALTVKVINKLGFYTNAGHQRWIYIGVPYHVWLSLGADKQRDVIGFMYQHEGGTAMRSLFPNYGKA